MENLSKLVCELCKYPNETPWLEFKRDNYDPEMIGRDISALANSATLEEKEFAYFLWGVDDATHQIVGTNKDLQNIKRGNEELENWLRYLLSSNADFIYQTVRVEQATVGVLRVQRAVNRPVSFQNVEYIRVGSYTKRLNAYPMMQSRLWNRLQNVKFEDQLACQNMSLEEALQLLDYDRYFTLNKRPRSASAEGIAYYLMEDGILKTRDDGLYAITNLGAVLFAKNLSDFPTVSRKAIRVARYHGNNRMNMKEENISDSGYAVGFQELIQDIESKVATEELLSGTLRNKKTAYPILTIREAIGNALIHQDFSVSGAGPTVEIFDKRIEIINPGFPLVDINRIIDNPPKSRNEKLAALMRRMGMCEELGTGWDRMVINCELEHLPAPKIELYEESAKVTLFSEMPFSNLSQEDKLWACYLHACILYVQQEQMTNSSLRQRFGLQPSSAGSISRLIKEAVSRRMIKPFDPETSNKYMKYIPIWA